MDLPKLKKGDKIGLLVSGKATEVLRIYGTIMDGTADFIASTDANCSYMSVNKIKELWVRKDCIIVLDMMKRAIE